MATMEDTMELDADEIEMDADDDTETSYTEVNVIMPPPNPSIFPVPKSKPRIANHWTNLSEDWNAEETGKVRPLETLYGAGVHQVSGRNNHGLDAYDEDEEFVDVKNNVGARLNFQKQKPSWEMKKVQPMPAVADDDDEDEGEIRSEDGEVEGEDAASEPENDDSVWTKRLKGPRMRMYADEEEANRKRNMKIKKLYGQTDNSLTSPVKMQDVIEDRRISPRAVRDRRLSRDETITGQRILDHNDEDYDYGRAGASRHSKYEDEDEFRRRKLYAEGMDRVAHRTIDRHRQKPSIKDRLGIRTQIERGERTPIKQRLGARRF